MNYLKEELEYNLWKVDREEYEDVLNVILSSDFEDCFIQDEDSANLSFVPKWDM